MKKKKNSPEQWTKHHRCMRHHGGTDTYPPDNIVMLPRKIHEAFHTVFGGRDAEQIAEYLNEWFIRSDWELIAKKREKT